jgi:hypothetical protein
MITAITTTATVIIMFLFLSGPSNIAIALSLSEVLPVSVSGFFGFQAWQM